MSGDEAQLGGEPEQGGLGETQLKQGRDWETRENIRGLVGSGPGESRGPSCGIRGLGLKPRVGGVSCRGAAKLSPKGSLRNSLERAGGVCLW